MRAFVILCLVALASAQYDYSPQGPAGFAGYGSGAPAADSGFTGPVATQPQPQQPTYNKEFFSFAAEDRAFDESQNVGDLANALKKNLRVIFIKGPENSGLEDAAVALAKSAGDQRTAIYVLNKQTDLSELANKLNSLQGGSAQKPEVHFVKYRTQADAENAQRTIQSQYDSTLPGPSSSSHGGHAPVIDFASKPQLPAAAPSNVYIPPQAPQASYLPPGRRY